ncbi:hypothetical protein SRHO_G00120490 [Serrasalmus rhombeus]
MHTHAYKIEGAKPCGRKQKGGVELRGARRHLGKAQSKQSVVTTRWYLHYRLSRPTPWRHQQDGLTAEVPKPGRRCRSALWERALLPQSLLSQVLLIAHARTHKESNCTHA